jgi:hypothetical protein
MSELGAAATRTRVRLIRPLLLVAMLLGAAALALAMSSKFALAAGVPGVPAVKVTVPPLANSTPVVSVSVGTGSSQGGAKVTVKANTGPAAGSAKTQVTVSSGSGSPKVSASGAVSLGPSKTQVGAQASVSVAPGKAQVGVQTSVSTGPGKPQVNAQTSVSLGPGKPQVNAQASVSTNTQTVKASVSTPGGPKVSAGVGVTPTSPSTGVTVSVGGARVTVGAPSAAAVSVKSQPGRSVTRTAPQAVKIAALAGLASSSTNHGGRIGKGLARRAGKHARHARGTGATVRTTGFHRFPRIAERIGAAAKHISGLAAATGSATKSDSVHKGFDTLKTFPQIGGWTHRPAATAVRAVPATRVTAPRRAPDSAVSEKGSPAGAPPLLSLDSSNGPAGIGGPGSSAGGASGPAAVSPPSAFPEGVRAQRIHEHGASLPKAVVLDHLVPPG